MIVQYKLSICIPTYNRSKYLPELLNNIISQTDAITPVQICISDNASQDNTETIVNDYKKQYPHIIYFRWPENMGADRNYLKVVEIASGEYCWLMGSDDLLAENALKTVLEHLQKKKCELYLYNRILCNFNMQPICIDKALNKKIGATIFDMSNSSDFINYSFYANSIVAFFSYISAMIFSRDAWNHADFDEMAIGTAYSHVYKIAAFLLKKGGTLYYPNKTIVKCRLDNDSFATTDKVSRYLLDLVGYDKITKSLFTYDLLKRSCIMNIVLKGLNLKNLQHRIRFILFSKPENFSAFVACFSMIYGLHQVSFLDKAIYFFKPLLVYLFILTKHLQRLSNTILFKLTKAK